MFMTMTTCQLADNRALALEMFRLRKQAFKDRRDWEVITSGDQERDRFDEGEATYCLVLGDEGKLLASMRLIRMDQPTMIRDCFPLTAGDYTLDPDPKVMECSRFCAVRESTPMGLGVVRNATLELLSGAFEAAHLMGATSVVGVYDLYVERILRLSGCQFKRLAPPVDYGGLLTVAGKQMLSPGLFAAIRSKQI